MSFTAEERKSIDKFMHFANKEGLHPLDVKRWNDFVIISAQGNSSLTKGDVEGCLREMGFSSKMALERADRFEEDRALLRQFISSISRT